MSTRLLAPLAPTTALILLVVLLRWHQTPIARASTAAVFIAGITILMLAKPDAANAPYIGRES